ncbi:hypothetical protein BO71DRAFT_172495 [Aspergillus ellipticus CBS 707.79]|uniref:Uncharacterized protein n=1 Tax=Aspergillus ellipticus CBS 707.79 TaxID=1448320 RepID=A0A319DQ29_9EURO|nr:hypothetical protein BO71DRAFT_172495 [Aspergillus ellipticus CBS 707.79]
MSTALLTTHKCLCQKIIQIFARCPIRSALIHGLKLNYIRKDSAVSFLFLHQLTPSVSWVPTILQPCEFDDCITTVDQSGHWVHQFQYRTIYRIYTHRAINRAHTRVKGHWPRSTRVSSPLLIQRESQPRPTARMNLCHPTRIPPKTTNNSRFIIKITNQPTPRSMYIQSNKR